MNIERQTSNTMFDVGFSAFSFFLLLPTGRDFVRHAKMIEHASDYGIYNFLNRFWIRIKNWVCRKDGCASEEKQFHIFYVNQTKRRFARNENQFSFFLQRHIRGAKQNIFAVTMS